MVIKLLQLSFNSQFEFLLHVSKFFFESQINFFPSAILTFSCLPYSFRIFGTKVMFRFVVVILKRETSGNDSHAQKFL